MCLECSQKYGTPVFSDRACQAVDLILEVYCHHVAGGGLHCLLDDWNLEDSFCERYIPEDEISPERAAAEDACAKAMRELSIPERNAALILFHYPEHAK